MTADEIRKLNIMPKQWLQELAAQLAELNQHVEFLCMELAHQAEAGKKKKRRP